MPPQDRAAAGRSVTSGLRGVVALFRSAWLLPRPGGGWGWGKGRGQEAQASLGGSVPLQQVVRPGPPGSRSLPPAAPALSGSQPGLGRLFPSRGVPLPRHRPGHPCSRLHAPQEAPGAPKARAGRRGSRAPPGGAAAPWTTLAWAARLALRVSQQVPNAWVTWGPTLPSVWPLTTAPGEADGAGSHFPQ